MAEQGLARSVLCGTTLQIVCRAIALIYHSMMNTDGGDVSIVQLKGLSAIPSKSPKCRADAFCEKNKTR
jgi:hypothetical protein